MKRLDWGEFGGRRCPALAILVSLILTCCKANEPGYLETAVARETKKMAIGGKDWTNPVPDNEENTKLGAMHFQHHCQVCHGLDGQNTGVPFADRMSPKVADLASQRVQAYTDGQLKWIIENGIRFTGMPRWSDIVDDREMWLMVRYLRHLPSKGSLGAPTLFEPAVEKHARKK